MVDDGLFYEFEFEIPENFTEKYLSAESISEEFSGVDENHESEDGIPNERDYVKKCHKISLQKKPNSKCKLVIKVFADKNYSKFCDTSTQTKVKETRNERIQTHQPEFASCRIQTETNVQNCRTQTPIVTYNNVEVQSNECRLHQAFSDSEVLTVCNFGTQIDSASLAVAEVKDSTCHAVCEMVDDFCQSTVFSADIHVQTELLVSESESQTDIKDYMTIHSQTTTSMSNEVSIESQATVDMTEQFSQVDIETNEHICQTNASCFHLIESEVQATVLSFSNDSQTELNVGEQSTITECNISTQRHTAIQSFVELNTQSQQTDPLEKIVPDKLSEVSHNLSTSNSVIDSVSFDSLCDADANNETMTSAVRNSSVQSTSNKLVDGISQTDPVTIIIGDASFLVQKLKSSAVSSSKVTTSGNEIEIELSADTVEEPKEERSQQPIKQTKPVEIKPDNVQMPKLMPMKTGGVRMRMPVSMPNPSNKPSNPCIINQTPIVPPSPQQPKPHLQPKVSSDFFSCPFCSLNFVESPALYEHLSQMHESDLQSKWKKSQGREGKTIIPKHLQTPKNSSNKKSTADVKSNTSSMTVEESDESDVSFSVGGTKRKRGSFGNVSKKLAKVKNDGDDNEDNVANGKKK